MLVPYCSSAAVGGQYALRWCVRVFVCVREFFCLFEHLSAAYFVEVAAMQFLCLWILPEGF